MSGGPVGQATGGASIGVHQSTNIVGVADGSTVSFIVRVPTSGVFIGGENLDYQAQLGGGGNPTAYGYELTANKEYQFTVHGQVQGSATGSTYTIYLYNNGGSATTYDLFITTL